MEVYSMEASIALKTEVLIELDKRLAEYREDVGKAIDELNREGIVTDIASMKIDDLCVSLAYDADALDEAFDVGYADKKTRAIISIAGVAAVLGDLVSDDASVNVSASQMRQMANVLMDAARDLDGLANRSTLLCG